MNYAANGLTTNPALNNGILEISSSSAVSAATSINLAGGTSLASLALANNISTPAGATVNLNGRYTMPTMPVGVYSDSGSNTIGGTVTLTAGGNQYVIASKSGATLTTNAITNNSGDATPRYLFLQGEGSGTVGGVIGNGTGTGKLYVAKSGGGTWTLNSVNTYNGDTTINGGVLALGATASISASPLINVKSGTLDVSAAGSIAIGSAQTLAGAGAVNGSVTDAAGSTLSPGNSVGTLTINNNLTLAGGDTINYEMSGANGDLLNVLGNITLSGGVGTETVISPTFVSPPTVASYRVASVPAVKTLTGSVAGVKVANQTRYTITPSVTSGAGGSIDLTVFGSNASLTWAGAAGTSTWDVLTSSPWTGGGASNMFYQSDDVTFGDSAAVTTVTLNSTVKPMSVTIANNTSTYNITGTGKISGATGVTKSGTGTATLGTSNDYAGTTSVTAGTLIVSGSVGPNSPVSITGGTLRLTNASGLGDDSLTMTAPTTIAGGTLDINGIGSLSLQNEIVNVQGTGADGVSGAIVNNGGAVYPGLHYVTMTGDTTVGGTGRMEIGRWTTGGAPLAYLNGNHHQLTKTGSNSWWLINLGYVDLSALVVNQGRLTIEWDNAMVGTVLGTSGGFLTPITVNSGGQFAMWGRPDGGWGCSQSIAGTGPILNNNITLNGGGVGGCETDTAAPQTYAGTVNLTASSYMLAATPSDNTRITYNLFYRRHNRHRRLDKTGDFP